MTPREMKAQWEKLKLELEELRLKHKVELMDVQVKIDKMRLYCKHPDAFEYSIMGRDTGWKCPDCGLSR